MQDPNGGASGRFIPPQPPPLLVVRTFAAVPYVHLHLESRRRFYPDVPMILCDDGSGEAAVLQEMCVLYGVNLFSPQKSLGPERAGLSAVLLAVQSAQQLGLDFAVTMAHDFVPCTNWVPQLQHLAAQTQYATYGGETQEGGLRSECLAFHAPSWSSGDFEARMERAIESGLNEIGACGDFLGDMALEVHAGAASEANAAHERLYPRETMGGHGHWPWLGTDDALRRSSLLRRRADAARDYHRLSIAYGLTYKYTDFVDEAGEGERVDQAGAPKGSKRSAKLPPRTMQTAPYEVRVVTHDRGDFRAITDANVLIYMPHGFGDWVQFSGILPLLEPSNRYFMTRFGDDSLSLMEDCAFASPLYCGHNPPNCDDGGLFDLRHFGLDYDEIDGSARTLDMPIALHRRCREWNIDTVFWTSLPDPWGSSPFPYHTKARFLLPFLVPDDRLRQADLAAPLPSTLRFTPSPWLTRWVESRLATFGGFGERKLCLITRNGYTTIGKNWGHRFREEIAFRHLREGQECRDFMRLLLRKDPRWMFLIMEDQLFEGDDTMRSPALHAYSYAQLFGTVGGDAPPFGLVMKSLVGLADMAVGIPAGPYHLCMAKDGLPTVGLWIDQMPSWYDEPRADSLHLISRNVRDTGADKRPGSFVEKAGLRYQTRWLDTLRIPGEQVLSAVEALLS